MNSFQAYGVTEQNQTFSPTDEILEEISIRGYSILKNIIGEQTLSQIREKLDAQNALQEQKYGKENLSKIKESNIVRCPLLSDNLFLEVATNQTVLKITENLIGSYFVLHLQNGVINTPQQTHHQSSWHRDLPYQDFVISKSIAISAFWCIDPFSEQTGGTLVLPFSHRLDKLPSLEYIEKHAEQINAEPGDVLIFDSMLYHRAGKNVSEIIRRGVNNVYTIPLIKQQINLPRALNERFSDDEFLKRFLAYDSAESDSVEKFRERRFSKLENR